MNVFGACLMCFGEGKALVINCYQVEGIGNEISQISITGQSSGIGTLNINKHIRVLS